MTEWAPCVVSSAIATCVIASRSRGVPSSLPRHEMPAREANREQVDRALRDLQPDRIALQRQREDFGGTLSNAEYQQRLAALERPARRKMPARAVLKPALPL